MWIQDAGYEKTLASFEKTLSNLKTDHLDLYLIHMPYGDYHGSWRAMEQLLKEKRVRAIGVCNFMPDRLTDLILSHEITPAVNQIELHPLGVAFRLCTWLLGTSPYFHNYLAVCLSVIVSVSVAGAKVKSA